MLFWAVAGATFDRMGSNQINDDKAQLPGDEVAITPDAALADDGSIVSTKAYERGGFRADGTFEVHRGVPQQLLVWP